MLENDQSFIYEKDEDEVNLKMDRFNTEPVNRNSYLDLTERNSFKIIQTQTNNKDNLVQNDKNKELSRNNVILISNEGNISDMQLLNRTSKKKLYNDEEGPKIISLDQVPMFRKLFIAVHPFVLNGYRIHHNIKDCLFSMFKLHNETLNIWTHFLPFWGFLLLSINLFTSKKNNINFF